MHSLAGALLHATLFAVIGFFVLFAAGKAEGIVRAVGMLLGWWLWILAVLAIAFAVLFPMMGDKGGPWADHMHGWMQGDKPAATEPAAPQPKKP
jgi:Mn2+/Fe2+ NRAMP family transporter